MKIRPINAPHVTVTDDLAVLSSVQSEAQVMVRKTMLKSHTLKHQSSKKEIMSRGDFYVQYNDKIENINSATHLGIVRNINGKPEIDEKIKLGRKMGYSLMVAGFHWGCHDISLFEPILVAIFCNHSNR